MVNIRKFLLALLPYVGDCPAPIFLPPAFAAAVTDDGGIDDFLHAIQVAEEERRKLESEKTTRPRPDVGGERISEPWLRTLKDRDCLYRFRYVGSLFNQRSSRLTFDAE
jgi:hypothetical protein